MERKLETRSPEIPSLGSRMDFRAASPSSTPAVGAKRNWIAAPIMHLDAALRRQQQIFEYSSSRACLFRVQITPLKHDLVLKNGVVGSGRRIADLHLWNEQLPIPARGDPPLAWGRQVARGIEHSLVELAAFLAARGGFDDVVGAQANMTLGGTAQTELLLRLSARFGFQPVLEGKPPSLGGRLHRVGENILLTMILFSVNAAALRPDSLFRQRVLVFLSRSALDCRFLAKRRPRLRPVPTTRPSP